MPKDQKVYKGAGMIPQKYFIKTGEYRAPRKGEFYLSGAIPETYTAPDDLSSPYWIMREVVKHSKTIEYYTELEPSNKR